MSDSMQVRTVRLADSVVDGLVAGFGAGVVMAVFLLGVEWALLGTAPGVVLARFDPSPQPSVVTGLFLHAGVSAVYGLLFGALWRFVPRQAAIRQAGWLRVGLGLLYGSAIFLVALLTLSRGGDQAMFGFTPLVFGLAHLLYGACLALIMGRMQG
jgi:hypothetical protein